MLSTGLGSFIVLVVAEDNSQAGGARHLQSFGSIASIHGVTAQIIEGPVQVIGTQNSNCLYRPEVSTILTLNLADK